MDEIRINNEFEILKGPYEGKKLLVTDICLTKNSFSCEWDCNIQCKVKIHNFPDLIEYINLNEFIKLVTEVK